MTLEAVKRRCAMKCSGYSLGFGWVLWRRAHGRERLRRHVGRLLAQRHSGSPGVRGKAWQKAVPPIQGCYIPRPVGTPQALPAIYCHWQADRGYRKAAYWRRLVRTLAARSRRKSVRETVDRRKSQLRELGRYKGPFGGNSSLLDRTRTSESASSPDVTKSSGVSSSRIPSSRSAALACWNARPIDSPNPIAE